LFCRVELAREPGDEQAEVARTDHADEQARRALAAARRSCFPLMEPAAATSRALVSAPCSLGGWPTGWAAGSCSWWRSRSTSWLPKARRRRPDRAPKHELGDGRA